MSELYGSTLTLHGLFFDIRGCYFAAQCWLGPRKAGKMRPWNASPAHNMPHYAATGVPVASILDTVRPTVVSAPRVQQNRGSLLYRSGTCHGVEQRSTEVVGAGGMGSQGSRWNDGDTRQLFAWIWCSHYASLALPPWVTHHVQARVSMRSGKRRVSALTSSVSTRFGGQHMFPAKHGCTVA